MDYFSDENFDALVALAVFKRAILAHVVESNRKSSLELNGYNSQYLAELATADLMNKLKLDIQELEAAIDMIANYLA